MKSLVIVESPAKAKTLNKFLGGNFSIKASIGHVKDLPKKELGVDVDKNFKPKYVVINGKEKILKELKKAAKDSEVVFLAPDPDREGEAIAWHIAEELNGDSQKVMRITFNEITERAVKEAIKHPRKIDMNLVNAQQARRILDRLVGYKLSPLLWRKVRRGLSAGRVQSVALRLIVDREQEINAFKSEEYWSVTARLEDKEPPPFNARLFQINGQKAEIKNELDAKKIVEGLKDRVFKVKEIGRKSKKRFPAPPFITSTVCEEASRKLQFSAKKTMLIAQKLYEGLELGPEGSVGLITYMRTDSVRVSVDAQQEAREYITKNFGRDYVPEKLPQYKSKKTAQEAHEAIRPTSILRRPEDVKKFISKDHYQLYNLIYNRFLSSQMNPAILEQTTITINANPPSPPENPPTSPFDKGGQGGILEFRAVGTVVKFAGFIAVYTEGTDEAVEEEGILPLIKEGDILKVLEILPKQHFTQPPPRYTEATLVKDLEAKGIGRPSTYATILSTIQERKYVEKAQGRFNPTELGVVVNDLLVERFAELMDISFTAKMEKELDSIETGKMRWVKAVKDFYIPFERDLNETIKTLGKVKPKDVPTETLCEKCGKPMVIRWGRHGRFMACSGYPECKNTKPIEGQGASGKGQEVVQQVDEKCEKCGSPMVLKTGRFGKFLACSNYPKCKTTKPLTIGVKCPLDNGDIIERRTKKGKVFFSCSNYPKCKFATWYRPISKNCPKCGADVLAEKKTKTGEFLICLKKGCGYKEEIQTVSSE